MPEVIRTFTYRGYTVDVYADETAYVSGLGRHCNTPWSAKVAIDEHLSP